MSLRISFALLFVLSLTACAPRGGQGTAPHGQLVLLHFWAPWCFTCIPEMEELKKFAPVAARSKITIRTIGVMDKTATIEAILQERKYPFKTEVDKTGEVAARYDIQSVPLTLLQWSDGTRASIVDPLTGEESSRLEGPRSWMAEEMIAALRNAR